MIRVMGAKMEAIKRSAFLIGLILWAGLLTSCGEDYEVVGDYTYDFYADQDLDGYGADPLLSLTLVDPLEDPLVPPQGYSLNNLDCNDENPEINPGATEIVNNLQDDNCDGYEIESGDLIITEIMYDPEAVSDENGEWFEILNVSSDTIRMEGWEFSTNTGSYVIPVSISLKPDEFWVLGRNQEDLTNGGLQLDITYSDAILLDNTSDCVKISFDGVTIHRVCYDEFGAFPTASGASISLDPAFFVRDGSDQGESWCQESQSFGDGDFGSPGLENSSCNL